MLTSRIASCEVSKAQGDADIRMQLTIDVPVLGDGDEETAG